MRTWSEKQATDTIVIFTLRPVEIIPGFIDGVQYALSDGVIYRVVE